MTYKWDILEVPSMVVTLCIVTFLGGVIEQGNLFT